jgi:hypothetical protein
MWPWRRIEKFEVLHRVEERRNGKTRRKKK